MISYEPGVRIIRQYRNPEWGVQKMRKSIILTAIFIVFSILFVAAEEVSQGLDITIHDIAVIRATSDTLALDFENFAIGEATGFISLNGGYLLYTSVSPANKSRKITAVLMGDLPEDLNIQLTVGDVIGGTGSTGSSKGVVCLSETPVVIIDNIGTGWTGTSEGSGARLTYEIVAGDAVTTGTTV